MFTPENEPTTKDIDELVKDEERDEIAKENVPDEVRAEIFEELERRRQAEQEQGRGDEF